MINGPLNAGRFVYATLGSPTDFRRKARARKFKRRIVGSGLGLVA
ncbi:MAG TPA: hypothetical protein VKD28_18590 [Gemmatimonadales bacterium]|nr:hypothetical protein [Gemmatimonadales bacterium]